MWRVDKRGDYDIGGTAAARDAAATNPVTSVDSSMSLSVVRL